MLPVILVLILGAAALWLLLRPKTRAPMSGEEIVRANARRLRDELSHTLFGEVLARDVWRALMACPVGEGVVHSFHRDFCGQGLIRTEDGVKLCDIQDGGYSTGEPIAAWRTEAAFVAFFARQSDYTCSGWDATEPVFATDDEWYRNNQRLTRDLLQQFAARS